MCSFICSFCFFFFFSSLYRCVSFRIECIGMNVCAYAFNGQMFISRIMWMFYIMIYSDFFLLKFLRITGMKESLLIFKEKNLFMKIPLINDYKKYIFNLFYFLCCDSLGRLPWAKVIDIVNGRHKFRWISVQSSI